MVNTLVSLSDAIENGFADGIQGLAKRKAVVAMHCTKARLGTSLEDRVTVVVGEVVAVKQESVRASITFPTEDTSLFDMFDADMEKETVYTTHDSVPLQGSGIAFALVIQADKFVDCGRDGESRPGWDIWLRNDYQAESKPPDGRKLRVHAIHKLVGTRRPERGDVILLRGAYVDTHRSQNWSSNTSSTSRKFASGGSKYFSILSKDRFEEGMHGSLEEAAEMVRENVENFWVGGGGSGDNEWGDGVF